MQTMHAYLEATLISCFFTTLFWKFFEESMHSKKKNVPFKVSNLYMVVISINNSLQRVHGPCTQGTGEAAVTFCGRWRGQETKLILSLPLRSWVKEASAAHCNTMKLALSGCLQL